MIQDFMEESLKSFFIGSLICFLVLLGCGGGGSSPMTFGDVALPDNQQVQQPEKLCVAVGSILSCVIEHKNLQREFTLYVPTTYNNDSAGRRTH